MEILPHTLPGSRCFLSPIIMAEVWEFFAMEKGTHAAPEDRDLGNMPTNQGKLDNGEWRCSSFLEDPDSCLLDNGRNAGKGRQWRSCPTPGTPCIVLPFIPEIRDIFAMENGSRDRAQSASCWNRCITWLTDGQWSNGGWRSPLMQSSRTSDPG